MTKKEKENINRMYNIVMSQYHESLSQYHELRQKYLEKMGYVECSFDRFIVQICSCNNTTFEEKVKDIEIVRQFHEADAQYGLISFWLC